EASTMEEHVRGESRAIHAFDSRVAFEPVACGVALARLIWNFRFAAIDSDKVAPDRFTARSHSAHGTIADVPQHREIEFRFAQKACTFFLPIHEIDDACDVPTMIFLYRKDLDWC